MLCSSGFRAGRSLGYLSCDLAAMHPGSQCAHKKQHHAISGAGATSFLGTRRTEIAASSLKIAVSKRHSSGEEYR
jgi:hypothetical protein